MCSNMKTDGEGFVAYLHNSLLVLGENDDTIDGYHTSSNERDPQDRIILGEGVFFRAIFRDASCPPFVTI